MISQTTIPLTSKIRGVQEKHQTTLEEWTTSHSIHEDQKGWLKAGHLVIPPDEQLKHEILQVLHDTPTAGHPG